MIMRVLPMLIVVALAGIGALSVVIVEAGKKRSGQDETDRRWKQWRHP